MPYFRDLLTPQEIDAVIQHLKGLSSAFQGPTPTPLTIPARIAPDTASVARGRDLYALACLSCHGADGRAWKMVESVKTDPVRPRVEVARPGHVDVAADDHRPQCDALVC